MNIRLFQILICLSLLVFTGAVYAQQACVPNPATNTLCNPLTGGRVDTQETPPATDFKSLAIKFLFILGGFAMLLPIVAVTFAGFLMVVSQGNEESVTRARLGFTWAVYGFVLAILSYVLVGAMINFLGADRIPDPTATPPDLVNPLTENDFGRFVIGMLTRFLQVVGILSVLILVLNGFRYITAGGDEEQATQAKKGLQWVAAGIVTILFSYVIIRATATLFGLR